MLRLLAQVTTLALLVFLAVSFAAASAVDWHIKLLRDKNPELRAEAARALVTGCCMPVRAVPPLIQALKDPEARVREAAAYSLGYFSAGAYQSVPHLLERLSDEKVEVRRVVILSLGRLQVNSEQVRKALTGLVSDPDAVIRTNVLIASAMLGNTNDSTLPILLEALGNNNATTSETAGMVLKGLAQKEPNRVIPALVEALKSPDALEVANVLNVLQNVRAQGDHVVSQVSGMYDRVHQKHRQRVLQTVVQMDEAGNHAVPVCIKALQDSDAAVRKEALLGLLRHKPVLDGRFAPIIESLKDSDEENRLLALGILKDLGNDALDAVPSLIALSREGSEHVRISAVSALGVFIPPSDETLNALDRILQDKDARVRLASVRTFRTLGQRVPSRVIPILEKAAKSENEPETMRAIMSVLGGLIDQQRASSSSP